MPSGRFGDATWDTASYVFVSPEQKPFLIVQSVFILLLLVGLLILSAGIFLVKKGRGDALKPMPVMATLAAMLSMVA